MCLLCGFCLGGCCIKYCLSGDVLVLFDLGWVIG